MTISMKKHTLVVVESDLEIQKMLMSFLGSIEYTIINFSNAHSALREASFTGNGWDIVITDFNFTDMEKNSFIEKLKMTNPSLEFLHITPPDATVGLLPSLKDKDNDNRIKLFFLPQLKISIGKILQKQKSDLSNRQATNLDQAIIGKSPCFLQALAVAKKVAKSSANIFISGESGTGKEIFARFIHRASGRKKESFVAINCSAIPENLLESELFGHAKGSFTGAIDKKIGLFESAEDGTLFLDEIGDLTLPLQAKLLRVLQDRTIKRVGENQYRPINCRIISATHKNLAQEVNESRFREDLYFRLNVIPINIPPLRERTEDILPLAETFLKKYAINNGTELKTLTKEAINYILANQWRGNVRELENTIERAVVLSEKSEIDINDLNITHSPQDEFKRDSPNPYTQNTFAIECNRALPLLEDIIQRYIEFAVEKNGGARDKTAKEIGIDRKTLYKRIKH